MTPGFGLHHQDECPETWWFPRAHVPTSFRIASKALAPDLPKALFLGAKPHLPEDSRSPFELPARNGRDSLCIPASLSSYIALSLPPSFSFRSKPCSWLCLYFFFCLLPSLNQPSQKDPVAEAGREPAPRHFHPLSRTPDFCWLWRIFIC